MGEQTDQQVEKIESKVEEKADVKEEEKIEEKKVDEPPNKPPPPFVLFVDLHCVGCAKKIKNSILKIRGVEEVVIDMSKNEVMIKGIVEPQAVCSRIMKKTKRKAKVLSPLPEAGGEVEVEGENKSMQVGLSTVELNVNMHCEACAQQLKKKILKMKGVQTAETELSSGKVTVTGTMDADRLVDYVYRRTKKQAKIVPRPEPEPEKPKEEEGPKPEEGKKEEKPEEKEAAKPPEEEKKVEGEKKEEPVAPKAEEEEKEGGGGGAEEEEEEFVPGMHKMMYHGNYEPVYVIERIPAPQLFSDENPNACSVM